MSKYHMDGSRSKPTYLASWINTYMNIICKSIVMTGGTIMMVLPIDTTDNIPLFGMMLAFIGFVKFVAMLLLLFLVFEIFNPDNKKNIIIIFESMMMILSGLLLKGFLSMLNITFTEEIVDNNFGLLIIIIGVVQLFALFSLYLWSDLIDLRHKKHLVVYLEPIIFMLCRTFIDDYIVITLMLRIIGGLQIIAMILF